MTNKHKKSKTKVSDDSDSDGAPEEMTFKEGLEKMLETKRNISKKLEEDKERLKQKRKRHEELFIEQKKQKLAKLESVKLSEDFLENIDDEPKKVTKKTGKIEKDDEDDDMHGDDDDDVDMERESEEHDDDDDDDDSKDELEGKTGVIAIHSAPTNKITPAFERAREFKMNALFGPAAKRQTMKSYLGTREKRRFRK